MLLFGLLIVFVLEYTRPDQFFPFIVSLKLYALVPLSVFVVAFGAQTRNPNGVIFGSTITKLLLALLLLAGLSIVTALDKDRAWLFWQSLLGYILLFFMIAKLCDSREKLKWVFRIIIAAHIWLIILNPALLTDPTQRTYVRNVTFLGDGNDFALSAAIALPMCLYLYQSARGSLARGLYVIGGLALFGAILGTQSRGAALAIIAMVFYLWTLSQNKGKATVFIIGGLIVVLAITSEAYISRVQSIAHYQEDGSAQGRLIAWGAGLEMALRRPLLGVGPGCFPLAFSAWGYAVPGIPMMNAHSVYFLALGELAWPGIAILLGLLWVLFRNNQSAIKSIPPGAGVEHLDRRKLLVCTTASIVAFAVAGAFLSVLYYPHLYVISGIVFAAHRIVVMGQDAEAGAPAPSGSQPAAAARLRPKPGPRVRRGRR